MHHISIRAVVLATLAVIGVDIISHLILTRLFNGPPFGSDMSQEQLRQAFLVLFQDTRYMTLSLILSTASTVLGGYLAARLAGSVPYFNALAFGALGLTVNLLMSTDLPLWFMVIGFGLTLPAALLGGHIAKLRTPAGRS